MVSLSAALGSAAGGSAGAESGGNGTLWSGSGSSKAKTGRRNGCDAALTARILTLSEGVSPICDSGIISYIGRRAGR